MTSLYDRWILPPLLKAACSSPAIEAQRTKVVPFAEGSESEQTLRARLLAERGVLDCVEGFDPAQIAAALDKRAGAGGTGLALELDGAARSADILLGEVSA